jgi:hypothetical protein
MADVDDLINKGLILHGRPTERGRTFIVTGLYRSGTSLVASILQQAGLFMGSEINDVVYQDEELFGILERRDIEALRLIVGVRNAGRAEWGFKYPMLWRALNANRLRLFDAPRLIVTFRDPVSVAVRTSLSEYHEPLRALRDAVTDLAALMAFLEAVDCPYLLLSYEKALMFPGDFIDALLRFCDIPSSAGLRDRLLGVIEPNLPRYIASARRRFDGFVEAVVGEHLHGWCCLTRAAETVVLDVMVDDRVAVTVRADVFRQDLLDQGIGNGRHGYIVALDQLHARPESVIRVRVARHGVELDNSGKTVRELRRRS